MNNLDFEGSQIQSDISLFTHNAFMIKKLRVKEGKFKKRELQQVVDLCYEEGVHLTDYGHS